MRFFYIYLLLIGFLFSCKPKQLNQKVNKQREGLWIENYGQDSSNYKSVGNYHNGEPIKRWTYYLNGKRIKKENYSNSYCRTKKYFKNGKVESKGITKITTEGEQTHWFYNGKWKYYTEKGKLILIRKYDKGEVVSEQEIE
jgi:antitoxin component YwqK of YwqJK toxin-antitoxin module